MCAMNCVFELEETKSSLLTCCFNNMTQKQKKNLERKKNF